jgi:dienelactone hydrolase
MKRDVVMAVGSAVLPGELSVPTGATGIVLFAHGSGSSRHSPRNRFVARLIQEAGVGTLLFDLLTAEEEAQDLGGAAWRFDMELLAERLTDAVEWLAGEPEGRGKRFGLFGASTGGGAALMAAAALGGRIAAVVSRGGRPDLSGEALLGVVSPVLLIVGARDEVVLELNRRAFHQLRAPKEFHVVEGATHLFTEPGALEEVARVSADWFRKWLESIPDIGGQH